MYLWSISFKSNLFSCQANPDLRTKGTLGGHLMPRSNLPHSLLSRRGFIGRVGGAGLMGLFGTSAWTAMAATLELPFVNGRRDLVTNFPQKGAMILQRTRPPLLETPFEVFDHGVFTPNDRFYVRWHLANIPTEVDPATFRLNIRGHVGQPIQLTLDELVRDFEPFEIAAVNQCSGNSRGFFTPRVPGGEWANGAMGNALWRGVRLKDVLDRAGVKAGALQVRFNGLDTGVVPQTPDFMKSLDIDHARDGEVMIAYAMNGALLPRLFFTNLQDGAVLKVGQTTIVRGIAFGGDTGLAKVLFSANSGGRWQEARLGSDHGKYSFRQWEVPLRLSSPGSRKLMIKAVNSAGSAQPDHPNWNGAGFMRNVIESVSVQAA